MREFTRLESLEKRVLLSLTPTNFDQYMLEIINRARANPTAAAASYGIDLNEGLAAGTISTNPKQPLAFNPDLIQSATDYSHTLLAAYNYFNHFYNNTTPQGRMTAAGYVFTGNYGNGENLDVEASTGPYPVDTAVTNLEESDLFIDSGEPGRGHRVNLMDGAFKEVGIGEVAGSNYQGLDSPPSTTAYNAVLTTEDFAESDSDPNPFLTGVVFNDTVTADSFYTPGEGLGGVSVSATNTSTSAVFSTTTWSSGGYSLAVPAGTYKVTFSGGGLANPLTKTVTISSQNVEVDITTQNEFATLTGGILTALGTAGNDTITAAVSGSGIVVTLNGISEKFPSAGVTSLALRGLAGSDSISDSTTKPDSIVGGRGSDTLLAGGGLDTVTGGKGPDSIVGGSSGHDLLIGAKGLDTLRSGAGGDTLIGSVGMNVYYVALGHDSIIANNGVPDTIHGSSNIDTLQIDAGIDSLLAS